MGYKIGLAGSPLSGKTTLGAMLYAEFLKQGVEGAYLIDEYAKFHLAQGLHIDYWTQQYISNQQLDKEDDVSTTSFSPVICDSCVWLGKIYCGLNGWDTYHDDYPEYLKTISKTYDLTIYVPLNHYTHETSAYRIHDGWQSKEIGDRIRKELDGHKNVVEAPYEFENREEFVKQIVKDFKSGRNSYQSFVGSVG